MYDLKTTFAIEIAVSKTHATASVSCPGRQLAEFGPESSYEVDVPHDNSRLRFAYIVGPRADVIWFLGLPFAALALAFAGRAWMSAVAVASIALWVDVPHQIVTLIRTWGVADDRRRFRVQLIAGLLVISAIIAGGLAWAPLSLLLLSTLWNHQHQLMQLHGFARIYDFKAGVRDNSVGKRDQALAWILYGNLFLSSPLFTSYWLRESYRLGLPLTAFDVNMIHGLAWTITIAFSGFYVVMTIKRFKNGAVLNPLKYLYILINYSVLYFVCWQSSSLLMYGITNVLMHGIQYMVFVFYYLQRSSSKANGKDRLVHWIVNPGNGVVFVCVLLFYAVLYQLMTGRPLDELGFGAVHFASQYEAVPEVQLRAMSVLTGKEIWLLTLLNVPGMLHLYYDSFIWKVREGRTQESL